MLDSHTKQRINSARQILVGKIPDPKSQVEQITTALIYKFMDDMDRENEEIGRKATFLVGELAEFAWGKLMSKQISGNERWNLYTRALEQFAKSEQIPELFRTIFKSAYLPYRDAQTLNLFLKEINEFNYDHSEKLGDAFEYLLSILGSQGDAGQFRTPRHLIDFIVEVVAPQKNERILDPACGTAGFLISSYKYIKKYNSSNFDPEKDPLPFEHTEGKDVYELSIQSNGRYKGDRLTPDDRTKLARNIQGYDIAPEMVRLSLVNMYLHGFVTPQIQEYDTLTFDDKWDDMFDVILANPPFMTPKGGIRPHKKFSVQANRAEVLFVDYIAEHLNIKGRAGIIVPEGIIFQSAKAYKLLRKNLVENWGLYTVVSLPSGVFQPYSGVKTSILFLDKEVAKKTKDILFVKIENDGFDLGAQRRKIDKNDLPKAFEILKKFKEKQYFSFGDFKTYGDIAFSAPKDKIREDGDYNLTGERYKINLSESLMDSFEAITKALEPHQKILKEITENYQKQAQQIQKMIKPILEQFDKQQEFIQETFKNIQAPIQQMQEAFNHSDYYHLLKLAQQAREEINTNKWEMVKLGEVCKTTSGGTPLKSKKEYYEKGNIPWLRSGEVAQGEVKKSELFITELGLKKSSAKIFPNNTVLIAMYGATAGQVGILKFEASTNQAICGVLPCKKFIPEFLYQVLKSQKEKMVQLAGGGAQPNISQTIIKALKIPLPPLEIQKQIVEELDGYQKVIDGAKQVVESWKPNIRIDSEWEMVEFQKVCTLEYGKGLPKKERKEGPYPVMGSNGRCGVHNDFLIEGPSIIVGRKGSAGEVVWEEENNFPIDTTYYIKLINQQTTNLKFIYHILKSFDLGNVKGGAGIPGLNRNDVYTKYKIPLPPLEIQKQIVAEIEVEQKIVDQNKKLIEIFEKKIKDKIREVWGE